jgi:hypothetical protein
MPSSMSSTNPSGLVGYNIRHPQRQTAVSWSTSAARSTLSGRLRELLIETAARLRPRCIVVDLLHVTFIDSTGMGALTPGRIPNAERALARARKPRSATAGHAADAVPSWSVPGRHRPPRTAGTELTRPVRFSNRARTRDIRSGCGRVPFLVRTSRRHSRRTRRAGARRGGGLGRPR